MAKAEIRILNEYRCIYMPEHLKAMKNENWLGYVYEHIEIVERYLNRGLMDNEVVHHLDKNRANNRIENLLVLDRGQHAKFHAWMDRKDIDEPKYCIACGRTLQEKQEKTCSIECSSQQRRKVERPTKQQLEVDLKSLPMVKIGLKYGVSNTAIKKWAISYGLI